MLLTLVCGQGESTHGAFLICLVAGFELMTFRSRANSDLRTSRPPSQPLPQELNARNVGRGLYLQERNYVADGSLG